MQTAPLLSIALLAAAATAQASETPAELFSLPLEELLQVKITSSTLTTESMKTVPSSMTVYTRADIRRLGLQSLHELANLVPGYQSSRVDDNSINDTISSRGRRLGTASREILVLMDGQRLNNDWNGGFGQHDYRITLENVERVEFIRGPGSALYGSNAMMGMSKTNYIYPALFQS